MKRSIFALFLVAAVFHQDALGQFGRIERWYIGGGVAFPYIPDSFSDYWQQGFQVALGVEFASSTRWTQVIAFEGNYFSLDQERFLRRVGITNGKTSISGGATLLFSLAYAFKYAFIEYEALQPAFFIGVGFLSSVRMSAAIDYPHNPRSQDSKNSILPAIPFGASVRLFKGEDQALDLSFTYTVGLGGDETTNTNFVGLRLVLTLSR